MTTKKSLFKNLTTEDTEDRRAKGKGRQDVGAPGAKGSSLAKSITGRCCYYFSQAPMKLPNSEKAFVEITKLRDYSLNPEHESGGHKARVFRAALGLTLDDVEWLRVELLRIAREGDVVVGELSQFGYVMDTELTYHERTAIVRTAWIIENGTDFPRLVSCYVK